MKKILSILFLVVLFGTLAHVLFTERGGVIVDEQRSKTVFPNFPEKISTRNIKNFFSQVDHFLIDYFPARDLLLNGYSSLMGVLQNGNDNADISKVYRGNDGWIFLGDKYNHTQSKLIGKMKLNSQEKEKSIEKFSALNNVFLKYGVKTVFVLGPNKEQIYQDKLPRYVVPSPNRYVEPILDGLRQAGIDIIDPTEVLKEQKKAHNLYYQTDTHWNFYAGSYVYLMIAQHLGFSPVAWKALEPVPSSAGDLISIGKLHYKPSNVVDNYRIIWEKSPVLTQSEDGKTFHSLNEDGFTYPKGQTIRNSDAPIKETVWIIGDSFSIVIQPYLMATFEEAYIRHYLVTTPQELDKALEEAAIKPTYAIFVVVERDL